MRYSLEPSYRRYVQGQGFMSFAKNIGNKYGTKIFDNGVSDGKDFAKIAGKKVLTKNAEATGDMIGNKIADRITKSARNKKQKEDLNLLLENMLEIIVYLIRITKINQLDLKHLC